MPESAAMRICTAADPGAFFEQMEATQNAAPGRKRYLRFYGAPRAHSTRPYEPGALPCSTAFRHAAQTGTTDFPP